MMIEAQYSAIYSRHDDADMHRIEGWGKEAALLSLWQWPPKWPDGKPKQQPVDNLQRQKEAEKIFQTTGKCIGLIVFWKRPKHCTKN